MDEMTAFERQMTGGLLHMGGAGRRIDPMAMTLTAATQSPKWRFQTMFSATKFVVAGAIVALFGGFLLSGVLTQPRSDELAPAAVSASPMTTEELLSGMVIEEVAPGVYRILDDGAGHDLVADPPVRVAVGPDDSVWLLGGSVDPRPFEWDLTASTLIELGEGGTHAVDIPDGPTDVFALLDVDEAGTVWLRHGAHAHAFDGVRWRSEPPSPKVAAELRAYREPSEAAVPPEGITWPVDDVRLASGLSVGTTGSAWVYLDTSPRPDVPTDRAFLARLEGGSWEVSPAPSGFFHYYTQSWLAVDDRDRPWFWFELRWPRELWDIGWADVPPGVLVFDGERWGQYLEGILVHDVAFASDGSAFVTSRHGCESSTNQMGRTRECERQADRSRAGLYVITPEAVVVAE